MTKKALTAAIAAALAVPAMAAEHTVAPGDHLWGLAGKYYDNHFRWQAIYAANRDKIKDPHWIFPGQVFVIPDVPAPEIGELPARPIEKDQEAAAPAAQEEQAPVDAAVAPIKTVEPAPELSASKTDDLSVDMPKGLAGQYPSMTRQEVEKAWTADGSITEFQDREVLAAEGDWVFGTLDRPAVEGAIYVVYRAAARQELDEDEKGRYMQRVGSVKVVADLGKSRYRFLILKSGDSVQVGDFLKREGT